MESTQLTIPGRGSTFNPANAWMPLQFEVDPDALDWPAEERPAPATAYISDAARTILAINDAPEVGFTHSINPYRGCEHGCSYCLARNRHPHFGLSAGLDFETKIFVKLDAARLLRAELSDSRYKPVAIRMSGATDSYQPIERKLQIARQCLTVLAECLNPVSIVTKNHLVTRDIDLLAQLAEHEAAVVLLSIATLDARLSARLEPRASSPARRLAAVEALAKANVPVGVLVAPVIPGLTDHEVPAILNAARNSGATFAHMFDLKLTGDVTAIFENWLERELPDRRVKVLNRIRAMQDSAGAPLGGKGVMADQVRGVFAVACRRTGLDRAIPALSTASFRPPAGPQMCLW